MKINIQPILEIEVGENTDYCGGRCDFRYNDTCSLFGEDLERNDSYYSYLRCDFCKLSSVIDCDTDEN